MKKSGIMAAVLLVAGVVSSWAQTNESILFNIPITFSAKLSDGTVVTDGTLALGTITFAKLQIVEGVRTDDVDVIGTSLGLTNEVNGSVTNVAVTGTLVWSARDEVTLKTNKTSKSIVLEMAEDAGGIFDLTTQAPISDPFAVISNSVFLADLTVGSSGKSTNINSVSGKFSGIWFDRSTAFSGSIKTAK